MLGDVNIAEPQALIGFAGPRVIQQTVRETLPEGFQRSEFLLEHGAIDMILDRRDLRDRIASMLAILMNRPPLRPRPSLPEMPTGPRFQGLADWLAWQQALHPMRSTSGLDRARRVLVRTGWQGPSCPVITVGGTNGKGSAWRCLPRYSRRLAGGWRPSRRRTWSTIASESAWMASRCPQRRWSRRSSASPIHSTPIHSPFSSSMPLPRC